MIMRHKNILAIALIAFATLIILMISPIGCRLTQTNPPILNASTQTPESLGLQDQADGALHSADQSSRKLDPSPGAFGNRFNGTQHQMLQKAVPIFVYHHIQDQPSNYIAISPETFENQLKYLKDNGWKTVRVSDIASGLQDNNPDNKEVALTFDDANDSFLKAWPLLKKYGDTATLYITTSYVGHQTKLTWDQIRQFSDAGVEIGDHTVTHDQMIRRVGESTEDFHDRVHAELSESKTKLEKETGRPVITFAYPFGYYENEVLDLIKNEGFTSAVTVQDGVVVAATNPLLYNRWTIFRADSLQDFKDHVNCQWLPDTICDVQDGKRIPAGSTSIHISDPFLANAKKTEIYFQIKPVDFQLNGDELTANIDVKETFCLLAIHVFDNTGTLWVHSWGTIGQSD